MSCQDSPIVIMYAIRYSLVYNWTAKARFTLFLGARAPLGLARLVSVTVTVTEKLQLDVLGYFKSNFECSKKFPKGFSRKNFVQKKNLFSVVLCICVCVLFTKR